MSKKLRFYGYRSFEPEYDTMRVMDSIGIKEITLMVSNNTNFMGSPYTRYQPTWIWEREYDFTLFDQMVKDTLEASPDAKFNVVMDLNPPAWWLRRGSGRHNPFEEFLRVAGNQAYRDDVVHYMQALLTHAIETFPGRYLNFIVMGGLTTEWLDHSYGAESVSRRAKWKEWCEKNGRETCDIPGYDERYSGVPESGGLLRTPATHQRAIDYWKSSSELSAETVGYFIQKAREVLPEDIGVGITYGYVFECRWLFTGASWGELEYEKIFDMPECDIAIEPISYGEDMRGMGGAPSAMIPVETLRVRGKRVMNSIDTTTFTSRFPITPGSGKSISIGSRKTREWNTPEAVAAGLKREMCYNLVNDCSTWHFDMWGGWYDNDAARDTLKLCRGIWNTESLIVPASRAEAVIFCDPENMYYLNDSHEDYPKLQLPIRRTLAQSGYTYTTASFNDMEKMDLSQVKTLIFCHPFDLDNGKLEKIRKYGKDKTVVWLYGPGVIRNGKWDEENVKAVTGFPFGGKEICYGENQVYIPSPGELTVDDARKIMEFSGAHCWSESGYPVYANMRVVSIHIAAAGKVTLHFPEKCAEVTELFSGKKYFDVTEIGIETAGPDTLLFRYAE